MRPVIAGFWCPREEIPTDWAPHLCEGVRLSAELLIVFGPLAVRLYENFTDVEFII